MKPIYDEIENGVKIAIWLENDCLSIRLISPKGHATSFALSHEATEMLRAELVNLEQLQKYYEAMRKNAPMSRRQMRIKHTQMNPLYWQLACMSAKSKEERMIIYAQLQHEGADAEEITSRIENIHKR